MSTAILMCALFFAKVIEVLSRFMRKNVCRLWLNEVSWQ